MPTAKSHITAVILAGGKGQRIGGQDKGLVEYQGKALILHVLEKITSQLEHIVINANRNQAEYAQHGYEVISDELSDFQGPLAGIAMAMQHCNSDYILTMPCDGPNLSHDYVSRMLAEASDQQTIVVAHDGDRLQPVHALIRTSLLNSLLNYLARGERKVDLWYSEHTIHKADFSDKPEMFFNVNTEAQRQLSSNTNKNTDTNINTKTAGKHNA